MSKKNLENLNPKAKIGDVVIFFLLTDKEERTDLQQGIITTAVSMSSGNTWVWVYTVETKNENYDKKGRVKGLEENTYVVITEKGIVKNLSN